MMQTIRRPLNFGINEMCKYQDYSTTKLHNNSHLSCNYVYILVEPTLVWIQNVLFVHVCEYVVFL